MKRSFSFFDINRLIVDYRKAESTKARSGRQQSGMWEIDGKINLIFKHSCTQSKSGAGLHEDSGYAKMLMSQVL